MRGQARTTTQVIAASSLAVGLHSGAVRAWEIKQMAPSQRPDQPVKEVIRSAIYGTIGTCIIAGAFSLNRPRAA